MMREAQKLMNDPAFQTQMRQMMQSAGFQQAISQTQEAMQDPEKVKEMEEKAQKALEEGSKQLDEIERLRKEKKGNNDDKIEDDKKDDQKPVAMVDQQDDIPDMPSLNLN